MIKVALIQMQGHINKEKNVAKAVEYIRDSASNGAKIICLQELFNTIYFCYTNNPDYWDYAETIPGPTTEALANVTKENEVILIAPIYEKSMPGELYNTAVVLGPNGELIGTYRKSSIPLSITDDFSSFEKYYFKPGNTGFRVFSTHLGLKIGVLICYDRHFPEAARVLALKGAHIVFVPTATAEQSSYSWEIELRAHAIENIYYVGGVNRVGFDVGGSPNQCYMGSSFLCDYRGNILSRASENSDEIIYAEISIEEMERLRNEWGWFRDRRPDLYGEILK